MTNSYFANGTIQELNKYVRESQEEMRKFERVKDHINYLITFIEENHREYFKGAYGNFTLGELYKMREIYEKV